MYMYLYTHKQRRYIRIFTNAHRDICIKYVHMRVCRAIIRYMYMRARTRVHGRTQRQFPVHVHAHPHAVSTCTCSRVNVVSSLVLLVTLDDYQPSHDDGSYRHFAKNRSQTFIRMPDVYLTHPMTCLKLSP